MLLGRSSNNTVYTTSGARRVATDCLYRSNSLIGPTDQWTDGLTEWHIVSRACD